MFGPSVSIQLAGGAAKWVARGGGGDGWDGAMEGRWVGMTVRRNGGCKESPLMWVYFWKDLLSL